MSRSFLKGKYRGPAQKLGPRHKKMSSRFKEPGWDDEFVLCYACHRRYHHTALDTDGLCYECQPSYEPPDQTPQPQTPNENTNRPERP